MARGFVHLLKELARLREFRASRRSVAPLRMAWRWYQRRLLKRLRPEWREAYVVLDNGDLFHVPVPLDMHAESVLTRPQEELYLVERFCRPGSTAIDVGANIGQWSVQMAKQVGASGRLFAFEPIPLLASSLRRTFRVNGMLHAEAVPVALSDRAGEATLHVNLSDLAIVDSGVSSLDRPAPGSKPLIVPVETLDAFLAGRTVPAVSFIKIDVEGHEPRVLAGAQETLARHRPVVVIETHDEGPEQRRWIMAYFCALQYDLIGVVHPRYIAPADWDAYQARRPPFEPKALNLLLLPA